MRTDKSEIKEQEMEEQVTVFTLKLGFQVDFKFIAIIPAINISLHSKKIELRWLFFKLYLGL